MVKIERIKCGNGNCYIISEGKKAILVDTVRSKYRSRVLEACKNYDINLIVLTHGHMDHVQNAAFLAKEWNVPIAMAKEDVELIENNIRQPLYAHTLLGKLVLAISIDSFHHDFIETFEPDVLLKDGDTLDQYGIPAKIIALPGHTKGSIALEVEDQLIVGDALMNMFYPTVSMLYNNKEDMLNSARKISQMGDKKIYFGHGKPVQNKRWV